MNNRITLKFLWEQMQAQSEVPYTISRYISEKWKHDSSGFSYFFGQPELIKKWRMNPVTGLRSLPDNVDQLLAQNPSEEGHPEQSGKSTKKEIYLFWLEQIAGTTDPEEIEEDDKKTAKIKTRTEIYNRIWKDIPPDVVLHKLTIPDDNLRRLFNFINANIQDPDPGDPRAPRIGDSNYEEKKEKWDKFMEEVDRFKNRMKEISPNARARYLFNIILFAKGTPRRPKIKGSSERAPLKAVTPKDPTTTYKEPEKYGRKWPRFRSYKAGRPYTSKKKRGLK